MIGFCLCYYDVLSIQTFAAEIVITMSKNRTFLFLLKHLLSRSGQTRPICFNKMCVIAGQLWVLYEQFTFANNSVEVGLSPINNLAIITIDTHHPLFISMCASMTAMTSPVAALAPDIRALIKPPRLSRLTSFTTPSGHVNCMILSRVPFSSSRILGGKSFSGQIKTGFHYRV